MCWMTWLPPAAGRDPGTLRAFVDLLMEHTDDNPAGAGASWFVPGMAGNAATMKSLRPQLDLMVNHLVGRPAGAWGVFHARRAPVGNRATKWCHPHFVRRPTARLLVTYNGIARLVERESCARPLWTALQTNASFLRSNGTVHVNPMLITRAIVAYGLDHCAELGLPNSVIAYEEMDDADSAVWRIRIWRQLARFPLYCLANGAVASENGGADEYAAVGGEIPVGMHEVDGVTGAVTPCPITSTAGAAAAVPSSGAAVIPVP